MDPKLPRNKPLTRISYASAICRRIVSFGRDIRITLRENAREDVLGILLIFFISYAVIQRKQRRTSSFLSSYVFAFARSISSLTPDIIKFILFVYITARRILSLNLREWRTELLPFVCDLFSPLLSVQFLQRWKKWMANSRNGANQEPLTLVCFSDRIRSISPLSTVVPEGGEVLFVSWSFPPAWTFSISFEARLPSISSTELRGDTFSLLSLFSI